MIAMSIYEKIVLFLFSWHWRSQEILAVVDIEVTGVNKQKTQKYRFIWLYASGVVGIGWVHAIINNNPIPSDVIMWGIVLFKHAKLFVQITAILTIDK